MSAAAAGERRQGRPGVRRRVAAGVAAGVVVALGVAVGVASEGHSAGASTSAGRIPKAVDIGFSQDMIVHHEQAVLMAQLVRDRTHDARIRALAAGIEDAQLLDIGALRGYLTLWRAPILPAGPPMQWMAGHMAGPMPGMATTEQLNALRAATGTELDRMFLQLMLRHHQGGLPMLNDAAAHAGIDTVRALAARMAFDQQQETRTIAALLNR